MLLNYLIHHYWAAASLVTLVFLSDYFMTFRAGKLYHAGVKNVVESEGGIELNPTWQKDIYKLKIKKYKLFFAVLALNLVLYLGWASSVKVGFNGPFEFLLGVFLLSEAFIHTRHFRNLVQSKAILAKEGIVGKIGYKRPVMHKMAALDALTFAGLYFSLFLLVGRPFFIGGTLGCLSIYFSQKKWLKRNLKSFGGEKKN